MAKGGKREGSGRHKKDPTTLKTFRVNEEALETCLKANVRVNFEVNKLVIRLSEEVKQGQLAQKTTEVFNNICEFANKYS
jgi:hypothetical protein